MHSFPQVFEKDRASFCSPSNPLVPPPRTSQPRNGRNNAAWPRLRATSRIRRDTGNEVSAVIFLEQAAQQGPKRMRAERERKRERERERERDGDEDKERRGTTCL